MPDNAYVKLGRSGLPTRAMDLGDGTFADVVAVVSRSSAAASATTAQLAGAAIPLIGYSGAQIQIAGLSADTLAITHSLDGTNYVTAQLVKSDGSTVSGASLAGASANAIYSVLLFGGYLKVSRTGSADTLTVSVRGTN